MRAHGALILLAVAGTCAGEDLDARLNRLLMAADSESPSDRAAVLEKLDAWCRDAGEEATALLQKAAKGASPEVAARIESEVSYLAECASARKFLAAFDAFELPSARALKFVRYNSGAYSIYGGESLEFQDIMGWLVRESETEITIADTSLRVHTWPRKVDLPKEWDKFKAAHPPGDPLPGEFREVDFHAFRNPDPKTGDTEERFAEMFAAARGELPEPAHVALLARWSFERAEERVALSLLAKARTLAEASRDSTGLGEDRRTGERIIADQLATSLRASLILGAQGGKSRDMLRDGWKRLAAMPEHWATPESKRMAAAYDRQLAEDADWKEPAADVFAALSPADRALYWMHHLRDVAAEQGGQPGHCYVLWLYDRSKSNPAKELVEIGWEAIPLLIEHMEDDSPTRSVGYWRNFDPGSYHLLTYKDACQQIFEAIAKIEIWDTSCTHDYPSFDRDPGLLKRKAEASWKPARDKGPEAAYEALLPLDAPFAAERLLKVNAAKWLPLLKEKALAGAPGTDRLLWSMYKLVQDDADFLRKLLLCPDLGAACWASDFLKRHHESEEGAAVLRERTLKFPAEPLERDREFLSRVMQEVSGTRSSENAEAWLKFLGHPARCVRIAAVIFAPGEPSREVIHALLPMLDDLSSADDVFKSYTGEEQVRVCDWAAYSIARALNFPRDLYVDFKGDAARRNETLRRVQDWLKDNLDTVDWETVWNRHDR